VVDGTGRHFTLKDQVRTSLPCRLEDHGGWVLAICLAVRPNGLGIDDDYGQMNTTAAASLADHGLHSGLQMIGPGIIGLWKNQWTRAS